MCSPVSCRQHRRETGSRQYPTATPSAGVEAKPWEPRGNPSDYHQTALRSSGLPGNQKTLTTGAAMSTVCLCRSLARTRLREAMLSSVLHNRKLCGTRDLHCYIASLLGSYQLEPKRSGEENSLLYLHRQCVSHAVLPESGDLECRQTCFGDGRVHRTSENNRCSQGSPEK